MAFSCDLDSFILLFAVEPPSDLKFKILNENTVQMSWRRPSSQIQGYRIQVTSDTGASCTYYSICMSFDQLWVTDLLIDISLSVPDDSKDFTLPSSATNTSITDLTPDVDYSVSINSFDGAEESIPILGQLTSKCTPNALSLMSFVF